MLQHDRPSFDYSAVREVYAGSFNRHFVASVPFVLEEQCRMGAALLNYCHHLGQGTEHAPSVYTLGDGAGVMARALSKASAQKIGTLNCSPNPENRDEFLRKPAENAFFFLGPFFELTAGRRAAMGNGVFRSGFDVVIEDTTFQMYGKERLAPIALAMGQLKPDGILILHEKLMHPDPDAFHRREVQKDEVFKARYFAEWQIDQKKQGILGSMHEQLVTLTELAEVLQHFFDHAVVTWNSGNFYTLAASTSMSRLRLFTQCLTPPAIPADFLYEDLPRVLFSSVNHEAFPEFRSPR